MERPTSAVLLFGGMFASLLALTFAGCDNDQPPTSAFDAGVELGEGGDEPDADDLDASPSEFDSSPPEPDDSEAGEPIDSGSPDEIDAGGPPPSTVGKPCTQNSDCADGVYCNGDEICQQPDGGNGACAAAPFPPCTSLHRCLEAESRAARALRCECATKDLDQDGVNAKECGGMDCDDAHDNCLPGGSETCDDLGLDEDCDATTIESVDGDGDKDGDGYTARTCSNIIPETRKRHAGDDCDDHDPYVSPHNPEVCNYKDDNCNGKVDEVIDANGTITEGGLRAKYLPDLDRDGHADMNAVPVLACDYLQPPGHVSITKASADDCNDTPVEGARIYPTAVEECDKIDNDCDELIDAADPNLAREYSFPQTDVNCVNGKWELTCLNKDTLFCPGDNIARGCSTDATRLSSCHACVTHCALACGDGGCDEIVQINAGGTHTCAATSGGRVACWGQGADGRLGNGATAPSARPTWALEVSAASVVALGRFHSCAVTGATRGLTCWGRNAEGQLGIDVIDPYVDTAVVPSLASGARIENVASVSAGWEHTCVVLADGRLFCFGTRTGGLLGTSQQEQTGTSLAVPVRRLVTRPPPFGTSLSDVTDAREVASGRAHSCAVLRSGAVGCWGDNQTGQLGDGSAASSLIMKTVPNLSNVSTLAAGPSHTCAVSNGEVFCWGSNSFLQLGHQPQTSDSVPTKVDGIENASQIVAGDDYTCALTGDRRVVCWGSNDFGQFGSDQPAESASPVEVPISGVTALTAGSQHLCAQLVSGGPVCWGRNTYGQLGSAQPSSQRFVTISSVLGEKP